jgi:hypothetical protein
MREHPILFTSDNAQKVHDGVKTQTRRMVKPQPTVNEHGYFQWTPRSEGHNGVYTYDSFLAECPYGVPGDRLWVREAWADLRGQGFGVTHAHKGIEDPESKRCREEYGVKWKPSIHMPRWACRIVLEITEIRVQRVQDCSTEDAIAEGAESWEGECVLREKRLTKAQLQYAALWDSINGPGSWDANPWVWAITFRVEKGA